MKDPLPRLDDAPKLRKQIESHCRLKRGEIWEDPLGYHRVGVLDATQPEDLEKLLQGDKIDLGIHDPPYNIAVGNKSTPQLFEEALESYINFSRQWITNLQPHTAEDAHLYIWLGADQNKGFQPLPDFMLLMREFKEFKSRSFISLRNQRGYGTQNNWMCARQELLYYSKGTPSFHVTYTDIPKVVKGYYKDVGGVKTENSQRGRSPFIRPGNVWVDIQQVFYRMKENVPGAYAQKPLKSIIRIIESSTDDEKAIILDLFAHSGTTLVAAEMSGNKCRTMDLDPIFAELTIRRLEHFRDTGHTGWQCNNPFPEIER